MSVEHTAQLKVLTKTIRQTLDAIRTIREAGIPTQASIAPLLPCDAEQLADLLDTAVDWLVVSSFRDDGGAGSKTCVWAAELYRQHGYGDFGDQHAVAVIETLRRRLGLERVRVGKMDLTRCAANWAWMHLWLNRADYARPLVIAG